LAIVVSFSADKKTPSVKTVKSILESVEPIDLSNYATIDYVNAKDALLSDRITTLEEGDSGVGDMVLVSQQTVSGLKTFLAGKLGLRNIADTFTSFFTNSNTASRTYTLQDRNGTLADLTDIASVNTNKMAIPTGGIVNYLPKFLTGGITIGLSRLWDTGTFFGIGTTYAPTKDITLGNQANREIGVEQSDNTIPGRNLSFRAGRAINFVPDTNFLIVPGTVGSWYGMASHTNGNVYVAGDGGSTLYIQTNHTGAFVSQAISLGASTARGMAIHPNGNVYVAGSNQIYMQTNGTGAFVSLGLTTRAYYSICVAPNGNVYAAVNNGDIYMQTNGTGAFVALGQISRSWYGMTTKSNGDVYAAVQFGGIYMQTGGTGNFNQVSTLGVNLTAMATAPNNNVYATGHGSDIYKQTNGTGTFVALGQGTTDKYGITVAPNGNVYVALMSGSIYMQNNDTVGTADLDGGTLKQYAGTGKGTGKSRYEVYTGQKTASGTDMQVETLREYIDENGYHVYTSIPVYESNALAIAGGLPIGCEYRTSTGIKMIVF